MKPDSSTVENSQSPPEKEISIDDKVTSDDAPATEQQLPSSPTPIPPAGGNLSAADTAAAEIIQPQSRTTSESKFTSKTGIKIGSRKGKTENASKPQTAGGTKPMKIMGADVPTTESQVPATPPAKSTPVPKPSRRDALSAELETEIAVALGDQSLDSLLAEVEPATSNPEIELESRLPAKVLRIHGDNIFYSLGGRYEGIASLRQFKEAPEVGTTTEVIVTGYSAEDGLYEVRVPGASIVVGDWNDLTEGAIVEARITKSNTGGLECQVNNIRGFIPASQVSLYRVDNFEEYIDQRLPCVVTEANSGSRNLVLSHRAVLEREQEESRQKLLAELTVGQTREGIVRNIREFGAFVDLGGIDGLIHISQLSWDRIDHPSEIVKEGQTVQVKIEKIDAQTGKLSLSYRDLLEHPWNNVKNQFPVNSVQRGTVSKIAGFGAFVRLAAGIEGLVHISELAHQRIKSVASVVSEGQEIDVKVLSIDEDQQRMSLSLKATLTTPSESSSSAEDDAEETPRELAVEAHKGPLKGGTNRSSGGEAFGLKW